MELSERVKTYLDKKRGTKHSVRKPIYEVEIDVDEYLVDDFEEFRPLIKALKVIVFTGVFILTAWAYAVVSDWNEFHKSKEYKQWVKRTQVKK